MRRRFSFALRFAVAALATSACFAPAASRGEEPKPSDAATATPAKREVSPVATGVDLFVFGERRTAILQLRLAVDGVSLSERWSDAGLFSKLHAHFDFDGNGALDPAEARRLPSPFSLRQLVWASHAPFSGPAPAWSELDLDADEKCSVAELADHYRRVGLGGPIFGVGRSPTTEPLTRALVQALDENGDGKLVEAECLAAEKKLRAIDRNDDEIVGPGDLVAAIAYPGVTGAVQLTPPSLDDLKPRADADSRFVEAIELPLMLLPIRTADVGWIYSLHQRFGGVIPAEAFEGKEPPSRPRATNSGPTKRRAAPDGLGEPPSREALRDERERLDRSNAADAVWKVNFGATSETPTTTELVAPGGGPAPADDDLVARPGELTLDLGGLRLTFRAAEGKLLDGAADRKRRIASRFDELDVDRSGALDEAEIKVPNAGDLKTLAASSDRDADGKLSRAEVDAWVALQDELTRAQALVTVVDHGRGLFELLDADHDGGLSLREIRATWSRMRAAGATTDGAFDPAKLPRHVFATISRGHPKSPLGEKPPVGPDWFRAMDRNGDGDVSPREFLGGDEQFSWLDADADGLLAPSEAEAVGKKNAATNEAAK